ncbi:hypothetical protein B0H11DRAFT_1981186, partial [Mycena galericulata]
HTPSRGATTSKTPPPLPLELKTLIAEQAGRANLLNFCATSREEYLHMMPILYGSIVQEVTISGSEELRRLACLLFTLGNTQRRRHLGPHPATLVRELRLRGTETPSWFEGALHKALRCTADYAPDGKSQLRSFHWDAGEITISPLLSERPAFENLAELSVTRSCSNISEFELEPDVIRTEKRTTMDRFFRSLELLPTISPGLTVLKVGISWEGTDVPLLEEAVNSLRLPCLEVASIKVLLWDDNLNPNFNPFLEAHPTLYDVSLVLGSQPLCDDSLPLLRRFTGRADDFLKVCDARARSCCGTHQDTQPASFSHCQWRQFYTTKIGIQSIPQNSQKKADVKALANLHELRWIRVHFWLTVPNGGGPPVNMYDEDFLDTNDSEDGSEDENDHGSDIYYDQVKTLLRVFRDHIDIYLLPMAPKLLEVEIEVVMAREQDPDSEHFDEKKIDFSDDFSFCIVHREGKRLSANAISLHN